MEQGAKDVRIRWLITKDLGVENFAMRLFARAIPPNETRQLRNTGEDTLRFLCLISQLNRARARILGRESMLYEIHERVVKLERPGMRVIKLNVGDPDQSTHRAR